MVDDHIVINFGPGFLIKNREYCPVVAVGP